MPTTPEPPEAPETMQYSARLNRDDRLRVRTLRDAGYTYHQIASHLQITHRQVQYTCQSDQLTPKKPRGQKPKLSEEDVDRIIEFISSSRRTRRLPYHKVIKELNLPVGTGALARALQKRGYKRYLALPEPTFADRMKGGRPTLQRPSGIQFISTSELSPHSVDNDTTDAI